jgi:hypothetical protein
VVQNYKVTYVAGGAAQNAARGAAVRTVHLFASDFIHFLDIIIILSTSFRRGQLYTPDV